MKKKYNCYCERCDKMYKNVICQPFDIIICPSCGDIIKKTPIIEKPKKEEK